MTPVSYTNTSMGDTMPPSHHYLYYVVARTDMTLDTWKRDRMPPTMRVAAFSLPPGRFIYVPWGGYDTESASNFVCRKFHKSRCAVVVKGDVLETTLALLNG